MLPYVCVLHEPPRQQSHAKSLQATPTTIRPWPYLFNVLCSKALLLHCSLASTTTAATTTLTTTLHDGVRTQPQQLLDAGSIVLWVVAWTHDDTAAAQSLSAWHTHDGFALLTSQSQLTTT
jgi:hypothetical protein